MRNTFKKKIPPNRSLLQMNAKTIDTQNLFVDRPFAVHCDCLIAKVDAPK